LFLSGFSVRQSDAASRFDAHGSKRLPGTAGVACRDELADIW